MPAFTISSLEEDTAKASGDSPDPLQDAMRLYQAGRLGDAEAACSAVLRIKPNQFAAVHLLAVVQSRLGRTKDALASYDKALAILPGDVVALNNRGNVLQEMRRFDEALASYDKALAIDPHDAELLNNRGTTLRHLGRFEEALASCDKALAADPDSPGIWNNRAMTLRQLGRREDALASYDRALAINPDYANAWNNCGNVLWEMKRLDDALASYNKALEIDPDHADALNNRANVVGELQRFGSITADDGKAPELNCNDAEAYYNRGNALLERQRFDEALTSYDQALELKPDHPEALNNRGVALQGLRRFEDALMSFDKALSFKPTDAGALYNRGNVLRQMKRFDRALASYDLALTLNPGYAEAFANRGATLREMNRLDEALTSYDQALKLHPDNALAFSGIADCANKLCDWRHNADIAVHLAAQVTENKSTISPFTLLGYSDDPSLQLRCARNYVGHKLPSLPRPLWTGARWRHDRVRIAYLSADFQHHATAFLTAELFERHDRSRFEVIGVSFGTDDDSQVRRRLVAAFDRFHDVRGKADGDIARLLHDLRVDIAIDLKGHTYDSRLGVLAHRAAPIQVSYLGYPGTTGADFIDYVIADKTVAPFEHQAFYSEKIVHLPDCYQVNDSQREVGARTPTRAQAGLAERGFVFCCFNNNWKITPEVFGAWMRLLHGIEGSVLWLLRDNEIVERNLRREAQARGIDPARLVFAARLPLADHLARQRLADLFLDTLPYNAHTTASDALWVGLPVLTRQGGAFAGRVAASLLNAIGLPELVTHTIADYESLALRLAREGEALADIKARLARNRTTCPLFDTDRFRRHIEAAYTMMWELWQCGEEPRSFAVDRAGEFPASNIRAGF